MSQEELKKRRRDDYKFHLEYQTRWSDNDMYSHLNNSIYYFLYDSIINTYLVNRCKLNPQTSGQIGLIAYSASLYFSSVSFPTTVDLALRVNKLGTTSVTYEVGMFAQGDEEVKAVGTLVHVFVDRQRGGGSAKAPSMDHDIRRGLEELLVVNGMPDKPKL
ncbi:MAG: hypothetical protein M1825_003241 [Sarcosagium campestre]|nr:MAG: hypothetical protein M1825_003241 [Sarcosagium campestre]